MSVSVSVSLKVCIGIAVVGLLVGTPQARSEDLYTIYQRAIDNDHEYRAARAAYEAGKESAALGRAGLLPKINAQASLQESTSDVDGDAASPLGRPLPYTNDTSGTQVSVSLTQPLFDLSAWYDYRAGKAGVDAAEAQFHLAEQNLVLRTARAYFAVLEAADNLQTAMAEEEALTQQLEQSRQRFNVGLSAITEVHESQAAYDSAVAARLVAEGQVGVSFEALEVLTGQSYREVSALSPQFEVKPPEPQAREDWVERALKANANIAAARAQVAAAEQSAKSAKAKHLPTLALTGNYSTSDESSEFSPGNTSNDSNVDRQVIGLTLNLPIFNGGAVSAGRRRAQQLAEQNREQWLKTQRDVVQATRSLHLSVVTSAATIRARKQAIVSNESAVEATQAGYEVGTRDLVDVLNAQRGLFQARRDYASTLYDYILRSLELKQVSGQLSGEDLAKLNAWLSDQKSVRK